MKVSEYMNNYLAIDTSTDICSLAIQVNDKIYNINSNSKDKKNNQIILTLLDDLLNKANISLNNLDSIVFSAGPGSFTGLRVAASVAQALAFANNLKIIKLSSLQVIAEFLRKDQDKIKDNQKIYIAQDARKDEIYFACYTKDDFLNYKYVKEQLYTSSQIIELLKQDNNLTNNYYLGNAWSVITELNDFCANYDLKYSKASYPDVQYSFELAEHYFSNGNLIDAELAIPIYIRNNIVNNK